MIRKSIDYSVWSGGMWSIFFSGIQGPVLAGLVIALGLSKFQIGLVNSMMVLFLPFQLVGALIQRKYFNRKKFWTTVCFFHYFSYLLVTILLANWSRIDSEVAVVTFISLIGFSNLAVQLGVSGWFSWIGELVPQKDSASFWSRKEGIGRIAMVIASVGFGFAVDWMGKGKVDTYTWIFSISVACGFISLWLQYMAVDPDKYSVTEVTTPFSVRLRAIFQDKNYKILVYSFSIYMFASWLLIPFYFVYMQETLGMSMTVIQLMVAFSMVISFISGYFFRIIGSKYGMKPVMIISLSIKLIEAITWFLLIPSVNGLWVAVPCFLGGFANMGVQVAQFSMLTSTGDKESQTFSVAIFFGITGLISFVASTLSGELMEYLDKVLVGSVFSAFNILHIAIIVGVIISMIMFWEFVEKDGESTAVVIKNLTAQNPFRTIYQAHVLSKPMHEEHRLKALSKTKGNLIASELIKDLYSPSTRVREAAIYSISQLEEKMDIPLIDELLKILKMPALMIQAPAARALGHGKVKCAVPELVKLMYSSDLTLAQSCTFALGLIADEIAIDELMGILNREQHRALWSTASEALGKIGNYRHTRELYKVYQHEYDWVMRKQTLIAVVNTISGNKGFYNAIEREEKNAGLEVEARLKSIDSLLKNKKFADYKSIKVYITRSLEQFDKGDVLKSAESVITALFYTIECFPKPSNNIPMEALLFELISENKKIKYKPFNQNNFKAVVGWLLVSVWFEMKSSPSDFDQYNYLTILWGSESLLKQELNI